MTLRPATFFVMLAAGLLLPASALAATATATAGGLAAQAASVAPLYTTTTSGTTSTTVTYDLTWTLPTAGKSGCTVCHSDPDLVRIQAGQTVSLYVDSSVLEESAHKDVPCTGCHVDFAYTTPHDNVTKSGNEWRAIAKQSCKNCHPNQFADYTASAHSPTGLPGQGATAAVGAPGSSAPGVPKPLCGDCHGGHSIPASGNVEANQKVHMSGLTMCGGCHTKDTDSYEDYYHGAAYKTSAPDAPACWDCHNTHKVLVSTDLQSSVNPDRLVDTCNKCHSDPRDGYTSYASLVHGKQAALDANPLYAWVKSVQQQIGESIQTIKGIFSRSSS
jgi:hypothetical protein